jgi:hypothetical protein
MATQTETDPAEAFEKATEQVTELADKVTANGKKVSVAYLDNYEKLTFSTLGAYEKAAAATGVEWFTNLVTVGTTYAREVTVAQIAATRELVVA